MYGREGEKNVGEEFLTFKGKPLVRSKNTIYYGDMSEKYVIKFDVLSTKKDDRGIEKADKIIVNLINNDPDLKEADRVVKKSEKNGFYNAMDIGSIWLERALKG